MGHPITITLAIGFLLGAPPLHGMGFAQKIVQVETSLSTHHPHVVKHKVARL